MKLFYTDTSPFVRKVMIVAHELGVADRFEKFVFRPTPTHFNETLSACNPLNKIPALELDDGTRLYDSPVICEFLDEQKVLIPARGAARFRVLKLQALCDGILDAAILAFYETTLRPEAKQWEEWIAGQSRKARQGLAELEVEAKSFERGAPIDLAQICAGAVFGWLEFRNVLGDIRGAHPTLTAWYDEFVKRPSMQATLPPAGSPPPAR